MDARTLRKLYEEEKDESIFHYTSVEGRRDGLKSVAYFKYSYVEWLENKLIILSQRNKILQTG